MYTVFGAVSLIRQQLIHCDSVRQHKFSQNRIVRTLVCVGGCLSVWVDEKEFPVEKVAVLLIFPIFIYILNNIDQVNTLTNNTLEFLNFIFV